MNKSRRLVEREPGIPARVVLVEEVIVYRGAVVT